jgi:hypothetical protein
MISAPTSDSGRDHTTFGQFHREVCMRLPRCHRLAWRPAWAVLVTLTFGATFAHAEGSRTPLGRLTTADASLVARQKPGGEWQPVRRGEAIHAGDTLIGIPYATIYLKSKLLLSLMADLHQAGPYPVIETAVILHDTPGVDLDFRLDRGRADVSNLKGTGPAKVRVRFCTGREYELTLEDPGSRVALEIFGRWPRGVPFQKDDPSVGPCVDLMVIVIRGHVTLKTPGHSFALSEPPGPAEFHWDNEAGPDRGPHRLEQLPAWVTTKVDISPEAAERAAGIAVFRRNVLAKGVLPAVNEFLDSDVQRRRRFAVYALGAFDQLDAVGKVLCDSKYPDQWDAAVVALRHWLGRGPGQDEKLYKHLIANYQFEPVHAEIAVQLLHSFGDADLAQPETYEALIDYLQHKQLGIRRLADWHLKRLVPAGRKIAYDPHDDPAHREEAYKEWKKLVPTGKLPPKPAQAAQD